MPLLLPIRNRRPASAEFLLGGANEATAIADEDETTGVRRVISEDENTESGLRIQRRVLPTGDDDTLRARVMFTRAHDETDMARSPILSFPAVQQALTNVRHLVFHTSASSDDEKGEKHQ